MRPYPTRRSIAVRRIATSLALSSLLVSPLSATWSIVIVDTFTREVAIGCATCLTGLDLEDFVPVMLVGVGGAAAQSRIDSNGQNRILIRDEMLKGTDPKDILDLLSQQDNLHAYRQYGIVDLEGRRKPFTGFRCGAWAGHTRGAFDNGRFVYAVQGNVLTGEPVVSAAETALLTTPGDVAEKLMAAMEAAASFGGDGRCSCDPNSPDSCGSPPPSFQKSAHIGFMMVSRLGDRDGGCGAAGCAEGQYYLDLNIANQNASDPDPVLQLRRDFNVFRQSWRGHADHFASSKALSRPSVPGNGTATSDLLVALVDWEGNPILTGGAAIEVRHAADSAGLARIGAAVDHLDGTYTVPLVAGDAPGTDRLDVWVDDGQGRILLSPSLEFEHTPTLSADLDHLSAASGGTVNFTLTGPEDPSGRTYLLLATASGTDPGLDFGPVHLSLNYDEVFLASWRLRNGPIFVNTLGMLASDGSGGAQFSAPPGALLPLVGLPLDFAFLTLAPLDFASNAVSVLVDP